MKCDDGEYAPLLRIFFLGCVEVHFAALAALAVACLMTTQYAAAFAGVLRDWNRRPPLLALIVGSTMAITVTLASSKLGMTIVVRSRFAFLLLSQTFRPPLEFI